MSPVAKLLIVVNLIASSGFLFAAMFLVRYARSDKPDIIIERAARVKDVLERKKLYEEQLAQVQRLTANRGVYEGMIRDSEARAEELRTRILRQETDRQASRVTLERWKQDLELHRRRLDWRMWDNLYLDNRYDELCRQLDEKKILKIDADNRAIAYADRKERIQRDFFDLDYQLWRQKQEQIRVRADLWDVLNQVPPEIITHGGGVSPAVPIRGRVVEVSDDGRVFMLSVGREEGVREGYVFHVVRAGEYVSDLRVEMVWREFCQARELTEFRQMEIRRGDGATTHYTINPANWTGRRP